MFSNFESEHGSSLREVLKDLEKFTELCQYVKIIFETKGRLRKESTVYQQESRL